MREEKRKKMERRKRETLCRSKNMFSTQCEKPKKRVKKGWKESFQQVFAKKEDGNTVALRKHLSFVRRGEKKILEFAFLKNLTLLLCISGRRHLSESEKIDFLILSRSLGNVLEGERVYIDKFIDVSWSNSSCPEKYFGKQPKIGETRRTIDRSVNFFLQVFRSISVRKNCQKWSKTGRFR